MQFFFWNMAGKALTPHLQAAVQHIAPDLILLAECSIPDAPLLKTVNGAAKTTFALIRDPANSSGLRAKGLRVLSSLAGAAITPIKGHPAGLFAVEIAPPLGDSFLVILAHLRSKGRTTPEAQASLAQRLPSYITALEGALGHDRTILVGDLNMNPFEKGLVDSEALHATMSRYVAAGKHRRVSFEDKLLFYNPMWRLMGSTDPGPQGTYYWHDSEPTCFFWNTFDQVLVRPSLLNSFKDSSVSILTSLGGSSLLDADGIPDKASASDHLPLIFEIDFDLSSSP